MWVVHRSEPRISNRPGGGEPEERDAQAEHEREQESRHRRTVADEHAHQLHAGDDADEGEAKQQGAADLTDFKKALLQLSDDQREALILVGAEGFSYEEAAEIAGCAIGTVKSRVNRARTRMSELLGVTDSSEFGPDAASTAALIVGSHA